MAKIEVTSNMGIIGHISPYSYQVAPKTWNSFGESEPRKQLKYGDAAEPQTCRFTAGQGKASGMKYFVYFKHADRQEWIELTADTFDKLKKDKALIIELKPVAKAEPEAPKVDTKPAEQPAPKADKKDKAKA